MTDPAAFWAGDGRSTVQPTFVLPGTSPMAVTRHAARKACVRFFAHGSSNHSARGATLWVILTFCQANGIKYKLTAWPSEGYLVEKVE